VNTVCASAAGAEAKAARIIDWDFIVKGIDNKLIVGKVLAKVVMTVV
jgi:hypothetical protein